MASIAVASWPFEQHLPTEEAFHLTWSAEAERLRAWLVEMAAK